VEIVVDEYGDRVRGDPQYGGLCGLKHFGGEERGGALCLLCLNAYVGELRGRRGDSQQLARHRHCLVQRHVLE
jgi:hypothetical protein